MSPLGALGLLACVGRAPVDTPAPPPAARDASPAVTPAPDGDLVYFIMVDRFRNGDPSNDGDVDLEDPQAFHGGDLRGVIDSLDYLEGLGVGTVWLSPIFRMRTEKFMGWGAFHGYWVEDIARVEPRFGGEEDLLELSEALDARGMRLVLDVVWNHVGMDAPLLERRPEWFHPALPIEDWEDPYQLVRHQVHGLPDLAQEDPEVYEHLLRSSLRWGRDFGVDGFRVDAVRHMPMDFLSRITADLERALGEELWLLGEDFQGDALALSRTREAGGFDAVFDFPMRYAMIDVFCDGRHPGRLASTLAADRFHPSPNDNLVTFLDNHDLPRVLHECGGDVDAVEQATLMMFALRGTPALTWGAELLLGGGEEPDNRRDMPWDRAEDPPMAVAELVALRRGRPALTRGDSRLLHLDEELLILARRAPEGGEQALILVNLGEEEREVGLEGWTLGEPCVTRGGGLDGRRLSGRTTALCFGDGPAEGRPTSGVLELEVSGAPEGHRLVVVGAGPELGNWRPEAGVPVVEGEASVRVPAEAGLVEWKLVALGSGGEVIWEPGENRYTLLGAADPVSVAFRGGGRP